MRVSYETRANPGARFVAKELGIKRVEVKGRLLELWEDSQDNEITEATAKQIMFWFDPDDDLDTDKTIQALIEAGFIIPIDGTRKYEIHGNKRHIDKLRIFRERAKKGGEANRRRIEASKLELQASRQVKPYSNLSYSNLKNGARAASENPQRVKDYVPSTEQVESKMGPEEIRKAAQKSLNQLRE